MIGTISEDRNIIACECGLQSVFPLPSKEEVERIYQQGYYNFWGIDEGLQALFELKLKTCKRLLREVDTYGAAASKGRRHLDIGCAFGYMIEAALAAGFESQGLEISPAADVARGLGYQVSRVRLEDAKLPDGNFDLITAIDVLEHIPDPAAWLKECRRILKQDGILFLVTPDCSSLPALIRRSKWPHYKEEHLYYYTPRTAKRLLYNAGFIDVHTGMGTRFLTLNYITGHYDNIQPRSFEGRLLRIGKAIFPRGLFERAFLFPSEMVVLGRRG